MKARAHGRAGGKVILLGEHAVVYGRPALAAGLGPGVDVEVVRGAGPAVVSDRPELAGDERTARLLAEAAGLVGLDARDLVAHVRSELPPGAGLGSSAALTVALLRALAELAGRAVPPAEEIALGRRLEAIFHGHSSGIDPAAAALGGCFRFVRGEPPAITSLRLARPLPLVIALGAPRSTGTAVVGLRARWEAAPERYEPLFDDVGTVVDCGARAAAAGDLSALGRAFDDNQALLETIGVSSPEVEKLVAAARRAGAVGAKLTGGGGGGAAIALAEDAGGLARRLGEVGVRTRVVHIGEGT